MLLINFIGNACCVAVTFGLSPVLLNFYNISGEARSIAWKCLLLCLPVQIVTYPLYFGMPAVLKANTDVKYVMAAALSSMIIMRVGLCYILTCKWAGVEQGAFGLWIGMVADWATRGILFGGRYLSGKWKTKSGLLKPAEVYGESERVAEEQILQVFEKRENK